MEHSLYIITIHLHFVLLQWLYLLYNLLAQLNGNYKNTESFQAKYIILLYSIPFCLLVVIQTLLNC